MAAGTKGGLGTLLECIFSKPISLPFNNCWLLRPSNERPMLWLLLPLAMVATVALIAFKRGGISEAQGKRGMDLAGLSRGFVAVCWHSCLGPIRALYKQGAKVSVFKTLHQ